ncbi:MAG: NuoM family protein [Planctomycetota bacterium]
MEVFKNYLLLINGGLLLVVFILLIVWSKLFNFALFIDTIRRIFYIGILLTFYRRTNIGWQFNISSGENIPFLPYSYLNFGINEWGFWLTIILTLLNFINIVTSYNNKHPKPSTYTALLLVIEFGAFGVLCSKEPLWFFIFFEFSILPLFILIKLYGYESREIAAIRYLIYTAISGVIIFFILLLCIVNLPSEHIVSDKTYSGIEHIVRSVEKLSQANIKIFYYILVFLAFAIKIPLIGFHFWLPYAHTEAPTAGSVLLAGIILKLGLYGYYLFGGFKFVYLLPSLPVLFSILNLIYGSLVVFYEKDLKKFIAYSSISHMGVAWTAINLMDSQKVALFYAVSHGISTGGLFILAGFLLENNHLRDIKSYQGLIKFSPLFCLLFTIFCLISMGFPGFSGFVGEIYTIARTFYSENNTAYTISMAIFILFNTWLNINLLSKIVWGNVTNEKLNLEGSQRVLWLSPLIILSLILGIKPSIIL